MADVTSLYVAWVCGLIACLMLGRVLLLLSFWPWNRIHPGGSLAAVHLLEIPPEPGRDSPYSIHLVESLPELSPYVAESEYFLGETNPALNRSARRSLYERWFALNDRSFLYLSRADRKCPVALSIILPLNSTGYQRLHGIDGVHKAVVDFGEDEIRQHGPYSYLLVDTFIICKRQERSTIKAPGAKRRYGRALLLRHIGLFWKDAHSSSNLSRSIRGLPNPHAVVLIAETNKPTLTKDLIEIGFKENGKSAIGYPLFEFQFPVSGISSNQQELVNGMIARIWEMRRWKIRRSGYVN